MLACKPAFCSKLRDEKENKKIWRQKFISCTDCFIQMPTWESHFVSLWNSSGGHWTIILRVFFLKLKKQLAIEKWNWKKVLLFISQLCISVYDWDNGTLGWGDIWTTIANKSTYSSPPNKSYCVHLILALIYGGAPPQIMKRIWKAR